MTQFTSTNIIIEDFGVSAEDLCRIEDLAETCLAAPSEKDKELIGVLGPSPR